MKTSDDHHRVSNEPIQQLVRESVQQETTGISLDDPIRERCFLNHAFTSSVEKRDQDERFRIRSNNSSEDMPTGPSRSRSSSRRSSSSCCSAVSGRASRSFGPRLSQSSSMSRSLSSVVSLPMSNAGRAMTRKYATRAALGRPAQADGGSTRLDTAAMAILGGLIRLRRRTGRPVRCVRGARLWPFQVRTQLEATSPDGVD